MVYLVNALAFDGRWETPYREDQVRAGTFTREDEIGRASCRERV